MFKKTRIKIIISVMAAITLLLFGTLAIIYGTSYAQMLTDNERMLEQYAREYHIDDKEDNEISNNTLDDKKDKSADKTELMKPDEPPPEALHKFDVSTFYSVAVDYNGTVLKIDNELKAPYADETLKAYADEIISADSQTGKMGSLAYLKTDKGGYTLIAFIDNTVLQGSMANLFRNALIFGGISVIAVFAVSFFISKRIIAPLEESFKKQKQFISDAGHELKTPLSVVSANAELLSREVGNNQWLANIQYENERMTGLVKQLLELAKAENVVPQIERLNLSSLVLGEILTFESVAYENGLQLKSDISDNVYAEGDVRWLKQLVSILIDNAICHNENGNEVEVRLKSEHNYARLSVINYGNAIPAEQQQQIFERFYCVDSARSDNQHFGLGLAIAKAIVNSHKGKINLCCYDGKIEFSVQLPL